MIIRGPIRQHLFFFSSRRRHTRSLCDWSSDVCSSDLINEDARKKVEYYVGVGRDEGAQVLIGGERPTGKGLERGWFYKPTVLAGVRAGMRVEQEEIFGPVLSVIKVASLDEIGRASCRERV